MRTLRTLGLLGAVCAIVALIGNATPRALASVSAADISSAGPLTNIHIGVDLSCQVAHSGDTDLEFYPPDVTPGDCGTIVSVNGTVYSPDFSNHDNSAAGSLYSVSVPFTPVSQTAVTGTGTAGDPFQVITVVNAGNSGLQITETDTYVVGSESYRTDVKVQNTGNTSVDAIIYRAGDCFLGGSDEGYGLAVTATKTVACTVNADNSPPARIEEWSPITPADHYLEAFYDDVWAALATGNDLPDTCICNTLDDNGAAINWDRTIAAGGSVTVSHLTTFSPVGTLPLVVTKTADEGTADPGAQDGYTISISNPNVDNVDVSEITDTLPAGFSYVSGSTTGATTNDPAISSQTLTWTGPFTIDGDSSPPVTLHFNVTVSSEPGTYYNSATVNGADAVPAVDVAPITVGGGATPTSSPTPTATAECGSPVSEAIAPLIVETTTAVATHTAQTTSTAQVTHTAEATHTAEVTSTVETTSTAQTTRTAQATRTVERTTTAQASETATATSTDTPVATATNTASPTATTSATPTATATECVTPTIQPGGRVSTATPTPTRAVQATNTPIATASSTPTPVSGVLGVEVPPAVTSGAAAGPSALPNSGDGTTRRNVSALLTIAALLAGFGGLLAVVAHQRRRSS